ncbi:uncharacterized protein SRS1_13533 [Sporisorium reilianum f. sp. reilianum]|nr:uncharacterized protein SRS1_13533 [Sporisorium reilianum f. sp. reilianum]
MYPSSAVAQAHVPGSAIGALQQPPASSNASSLHHNRTWSIIQNPSFDNKHSAYRSADVSVSVNKVTYPSYTAQQPQQSNTTTSASEKETTITSTNTATSSAMMIDDPVAASGAGKASNHVGTSTDGNGDKNGEAKQQPAAEANTEQTDENGSNSAVRKVRSQSARSSIRSGDAD